MEALGCHMPRDSRIKSFLCHRFAYIRPMAPAPYSRVFVGIERIVAVSGSRVYILSSTYVSVITFPYFLDSLMEPEQAMS